MSGRDDLGDHIKSYEARETERRAMPGLPLVARIDGRSFSRFTMGLPRPYDQDFADLMVETTKYLVEQISGARVALTQSDEINIIIDPFGSPSAAEVLRRLEDYLEGCQPRASDPEYPETPDREEAEDADLRQPPDVVRAWIAEIRQGCRIPQQAVEFMFGGRKFKLTSVIAGLATARFLKDAIRLWPDRCARQLPVFDCRVFEVPNRQEAVNVLVWRELVMSCPATVH